jgi:NADPH:quinone reductase-like Zn-dependent oxidoreductase
MDDPRLLPDGLATQWRAAHRVLQEFLDAVADGRAVVPIGKVYGIDDIVQAHRDMEAGTVGGKGVVVL